jgi:hypothetical protein
MFNTALLRTVSVASELRLLPFKSIVPVAAAPLGAPTAVGVDLYRDLPMPPGNEELQAIQRAHDNLYWVFKLPDAGNIGVPPPPVLRETGREALADHVTDAGGVVRRALLLAADERTDHNWRTLGVSWPNVTPKRCA